jgi:hypothetical protein
VPLAQLLVLRIGLNAAIQRAIAARGGSSFSPDLGKGIWRRRSNGMVSESGEREDGSVREDQLLVVKIAENGQIGVICGRATAHRVVSTRCRENPRT